jgi:hypothetical protein
MSLPNRTGNIPARPTTQLDVRCSCENIEKFADFAKVGKLAPVLPEMVLANTIISIIKWSIILLCLFSF